MSRIAHALAITALAGCAITTLMPAAAAQTMVEQMHARAALSFQHGRYAEAYGRFMALADAGHAPSAEVALFMYSNGHTLFGSDWDVTPDQLEAWAKLAGRPVPMMVAAPSLRASTARPH